MITHAKILLKTAVRRLCKVFVFLSWVMFTVTPAFADKGINGNELYRLNAADLASTIEGYRTLGVRWVRFDFDWSVIQPTPGNYNFAAHDAVVDALTKARINVLGLIGYTPAWANGGQSSKFYPPTNMAAFAKFAATLASRYAPRGVHAWEIWNEPNLAQFWGPAPDPNAYAAMLKQTYPAIKRKDRSAIVVTGGLAQPGNSALTIDSVYFLELLYGNGAKPYFDAVGNHPYTSPRMPMDEGMNNWKKMYESFASMRAVMAQYSDSNKAIWVTEYGGPTYGTDSYGTTMSEEHQAMLVQQSFQIIASYPWAGPLFWYNYKDFCPYAPGKSTECYYGLVRSDGTPKPAISAYQQAKK